MSQLDYGIIEKGKSVHIVGVPDLEAFSHIIRYKWDWKIMLTVMGVNMEMIRYWEVSLYFMLNFAW